MAAGNGIDYLVAGFFEISNFCRTGLVKFLLVEQAIAFALLNSVVDTAAG
ncbi:hypothetical protein PF586_06525 [Lactobacillus delbrueckii]|uniref:Uncharacterized protein n=1 Tax=Lactobacillus delbrueckii TaxID=1584 RepID=A0AAW5YY34_9LACO|nr:hypothetical protein [Lactobacillus delbrueckii]MDA3768113.1 hypothetical protein [Lactobacillus delbrueckii]